MRIRAETTKSGRERIVPYSAASGELLKAYLAHRRTLSQERGRLLIHRRVKASFTHEAFRDGEEPLPRDRQDVRFRR